MGFGETAEDSQIQILVEDCHVQVLVEDHTPVEGFCLHH